MKKNSFVDTTVVAFSIRRSPTISIQRNGSTRKNNVRALKTKWIPSLDWLTQTRWCDVCFCGKWFAFRQRGFVTPPTESVPSSLLARPVCENHRILSNGCFLSIDPITIASDFQSVCIQSFLYIIVLKNLFLFRPTLTYFVDCKNAPMSIL